ncbi:hypothetical protein QBC47DRAFT_74230 [Echria macrotheca]|uniref:BZIP domain-containing protein n=1 Tax=Echria macrotheca TaxID=438768 RepID=A0AAJ0F813_9PEZI|nr:hypothetical protein QBC47DRAFT_74230 [Echria macrotheca]
MSPRPPSASHRPSQSPPREAGSSSPSRQNPAHRDDSSARPPHDPGGGIGPEGEGGSQRRGSRTSGVHNILNPSGPRAPAPASSPPIPHPHGEASPQQKMGLGQYGGISSPSRPAGYQGHGAVTPQPAHPAMPLSQSPGAPLPSGSPPAPHPYPLAAARRILTPKSPRAASLSRAAMRAVEAQRLSSLPPHPGRPGIPPHDSSPLGGTPGLGASPQFPGPIHAPGAAGPPPSRPTSNLSRSLSQPMIGHAGPPPTSQEPLPPGGVARDVGGRAAYSPGPPFGAGPGPSRMSAGDQRWGQGVLGPLPASSSGARNLQLGEGQQHLLAITPTHGEEILIPVDIHQASKQADEKRMRNAGASARFRQRKKEREKEIMQELDKVEATNRDLERRIEELESRNQDLEVERDYYRSERNRLRDIVSRTPGISEWADRGPPSPTPSRAAGSFAADNSPLPPPTPPAGLPPMSHPYPAAHTHTHSHALAHPHPPPSSYDDPAMHERPARRRRTDSEPSLGTPSYRPTTPASLPPIPGQGSAAYSIPPSPLLAPAPGTARLPPIRYNHPPTSETPPPIQSGPPPPIPSQPGQSSTYPSYGKAPYETGWATGPRGPGEGPTR